MLGAHLRVLDPSLGAGLRGGMAGCLRAVARRAGRLSDLSCVGHRAAGLGRGHGVFGGPASDAVAVGFLSARATAVVRVGAPVERGTALLAPQKTRRGHEKALQRYG
jgi:hypothetical protein